MEGTYWVRIGAIFALFLGSLWVLLPTIVRESAETRFARQAESIESAEATPVVEVRPEGAPDATAEVLKRRLGGEVTIAVQGANVVVTLPNEAARAGVEALAGRVGALSVFPVSSLGAPVAPAEGATPGAGEQFLIGLGASASDAASAVATLAARAEPLTEGALPVAISSVVTAAEPLLSVTLADPAAWPADVPYAVLALDGAPVGFVSAQGAGYLARKDDGTVAVLASGALPGAVQIAPAAAPAEKPAAAAAAPESPLPEWLAKSLPDTAIPLGLDLQGGIDLTLQVELDEAILGQVSRDAVSLKDAGAKEGVAIQSARRDHNQPVIEITSDAKLADLQEFVRKRTQGEYAYLGTEGQTHRFELSEVRQEQIKDQAVEQVLDTLRKRVDATGVKDPAIVRKSGGRINIQLPGMDDVQAAVDMFGTMAVLEFRMVDEDFDESVLGQWLLVAEKEMPPGTFQDDERVNEFLWDTKRLDPARILLWHHETGPDGKDMRLGEPLALINEVVLTGNDVNDAGVQYDQRTNEPQVMLEFKPRGGQIFCEVTGEAVGKRFGIILDGVLKSAPVIKQQICGGSASIEMGGADDPGTAAKNLALVLRTGALDAPVVVASKSHVGATLGADAIREGTIAAVVGSVLVYIFMVVWYSTAGVIADIALTCNVLLVLAALGVFEATLTLPGIAGIALTVGMAVDSNIIVYERIREELRLGIHPRKAVDVGFEKALVAVIDANVTTAIAGIVLYSYGTGPVKGFAVTLLVGIVTTLVTAIFVTRTIMDAMTRSSAARLQI